MKPKHTPGPWTIETQFKTLTNLASNTETRLRFFEVGSDLRRLATVNSGMNDEADDQLISAAPEMLEALEALLNEATLKQRSTGGVYDRAAMVINKARGQS